MIRVDHNIHYKTVISLSVVFIDFRVNVLIKNQTIIKKTNLNGFTEEDSDLNY